MFGIHIYIAHTHRYTMIYICYIYIYIHTLRGQGGGVCRPGILNISLMMTPAFGSLLFFFTQLWRITENHHEKLVNHPTTLEPGKSGSRNPQVLDRNDHGPNAIRNNCFTGSYM